MNDDLLNKAKDQAAKAKHQAEALADKLKPHVKDALNETQRQTENAIGEIGSLFRQAAKKVRDDIAKRQ